MFAGRVDFKVYQQQKLITQNDTGKQHPWLIRVLGWVCWFTTWIIILPTPTMQYYRQITQKDNTFCIFDSPTLGKLTTPVLFDCGLPQIPRGQFLPETFVWHSLRVNRLFFFLSTCIPTVSSLTKGLIKVSFLRYIYSSKGTFHVLEHNTSV